MPTKEKLALKPRSSSGSIVRRTDEGGWHLEIPPGSAGYFRLAQLDEHALKGRQSFPWKPPLTLRLRARTSAEGIPGTWGFGLWNDPFSMSLDFGGGTRRLPVLPNAVWFLHACSQNYLSLRDDLPANGFLAATFRSRPLPTAILALGITALPLLAWSPTARLLRRIGRNFILQGAETLTHATNDWHTYALEWQERSVVFRVDEDIVFVTPISPHPPLGLVLWIDNQYASFPPTGRLRYGTRAYSKPSWLELDQIAVYSDTVYNGAVNSA